MATITIDGKEYDVETLSDETKAQLGSLQYVDSELARLQAQCSRFANGENGLRTSNKADTGRGQSS